MNTSRTFSGFSLIEVMIAIAIASFISLLLFESFGQLNRSVASLDATIDEHTKATLLSWHMTKDIAGSFIPPRAIKERTKKDTPEKTDSKDAQGKEQKPAEEPEKKESVKPLTHIFYATATDNKNMDILTCVTNNPLHVYWSESTGSAKPTITRILYTLKPEAQTKRGMQPSYALWRQETTNLDFAVLKEDDGKKIRSYEVVRGVKQLTLTYLSAPPPPKPADPGAKNPQEKQPEKATQQSKPIQYKTFEFWNKEQKGQPQNEKDKEPDPIIPHFVNVTATLWANQQKGEKTFSFVIPIYPDVQYLPQKKETKPEPPNQPGAAPVGVASADTGAQSS
jgi:prepilin-type N-terminal cleavage/methylation domain-containing protein